MGIEAPGTVLTVSHDDGTDTTSEFDVERLPTREAAYGAVYESRSLDLDAPPADADATLTVRGDAGSYSVPCRVVRELRRVNPWDSEVYVRVPRDASTPFDEARFRAVLGADED
ncbi:uncharacterized protein HHUB_2991 [Halobacterium hubeiense]|jgi:hypothetical protein|uniref:Uncharacterized protein n=2 Tax=Halobacterium TaxID=2239 RepID=A0A0U5AGC8_9EURY|nr:hypothetical protein [Halobacterium hubeiense]CQH59491.1 uncharacterized protein HHUB_2991 [Halobacterium hubeiense]